MIEAKTDTRGTLCPLLWSRTGMFFGAGDSFFRRVDPPRRGLGLYAPAAAEQARCPRRKLPGTRITQEISAGTGWEPSRAGCR